MKAAEFEGLDEVDDEVRRLLKELLARRPREATYLQEVLAIAADYACWASRLHFLKDGS